jgi:hypothetical protein
MTASSVFARSTHNPSNKSNSDSSTAGEEPNRATTAKPATLDDVVKLMVRELLRGNL